VDLRNLLRKEVRVTGGGVEYSGTLIEATEDNILLKTDSGFVSVSTAKISSVRPKDESSNVDLGDNKYVSRSFYEFDDSE
jgi:hypothetical protein